MPLVPINDTAIQLSQSITRDSQIQNTGASPVYLSNESAVSPGSYGSVLGPNSTVMWPANSELWAVCAPGDTSELAVLYSAYGVGVGEVGVSGPVTIGNNVRVQGGGELLFSTVQALASEQVLFLTIPAPLSGQTYTALRVSIALVGVGGSEGEYFHYGLSIANGRTVDGVLINPTPSATVLELGRPNTHTFTTPFDGAYPASLVVTAPSFVIPHVETLNVRVWGVVSEVNAPVTDLLDSVNSLPMQQVINTSVTERRLYLPPSYTPYSCLYAINTGGGAGSTNVHHYMVDPLTLVPNIIEENVNYNYLTGTLVTASGGKTQFIHPGFGLSSYLRFFPTAANTGTMRITIRNDP